MQESLFGEASGEYAALVGIRSFPSSLEVGAVERIVSILKAQEILLSGDPFIRDESGAREIPGLIRYARSLAEGGSAARRKTAIVPRNLGSAFAASGWGEPLFGRFRPPSPPAEGGAILVYRSADGDGTARIEAARLGTGISIAYRGAGIALGSRARWIGCSVLPPGEGDGSGRADRHEYGRCVVVLERSPRARRFAPRRVDPYLYEYAYHFSGGARLESNVARFVADLLSGIFGLPLREAEGRAWDFSGRLPGR